MAARKNGGAKPAAIASGKPVLVDIKDGIAWVTLDPPEKRNAISPALSEEMIATLDRLEPDPNVGVVVLTGVGNAYCAGMELKEFSPRYRQHDCRRARRVLARQRHVAVAPSQLLHEADDRDGEWLVLWRRLQLGHRLRSRHRRE